MKKLVVAIMVILFTVSKAGYADEASRKALAVELMTLMKVEESIEELFKNIDQMQTAQMERISPQQEGMPESAKLMLNEMRQEMMGMIHEQLSWESMQEEYISVYTDTFGEEELQGIVRFYKSEIGQVFIEKMPELMKKSMEISQRRVQELMPRLQHMFQEMEKKVNDEQKGD
jgi:hypothetical protein